MLKDFLPSQEIAEDPDDPCPIDLSIHPSVDPLAIGVGVLFAVLTVLALAVRILCTIRAKRTPKVEEYGALIGFIVFTAYMCVEISRMYPNISRFRPAITQ